MLWKEEQGKLLRDATAKEELKGQRGWEKVWGVSRPPSKTLAKKSKLKESSNSLVTAIAHHILASMGFSLDSTGPSKTSTQFTKHPRFYTFSTGS